MAPRCSRILALPSSLLRTFPSSQRCLFSTSSARAEAPQSDNLAAATEVAVKENSRWLGETKARLGKCITFGMNAEQIRDAAGVLKILGEEWRELVAGREGFLTSKKRAGLMRHRVVWGEMVDQAHVNNVTYTRYAESARIQWTSNYAQYIDPANSAKWSQLWTPHGTGLILRSIKTVYKFPMTWPDRVSVFQKLRALPKSSDESFTLDVVIMSEGKQRVAARCEEDNVVYDYKAGRKGKVGGWMLEAFEKVWKEQKEQKIHALNRIKEIEEVVDRLERETWNREDAVEDMGTS